MKYDENAFKVLEGLEPVCLRPGQFTITKEGHLGSPDGDSSATFRYCFAAGTRVSTKHGLVPIEEVPALYQQPRDVLTRRYELSIRMKVATRGAPRPALFWVNSGIQQTVRVTTRRDYLVRCTPNKPFLVLNPRLEYEWKDADKLTCGDLLCLSRNPRVQPEGGEALVTGFRPGLQTAHFAGLLSGRVECIENDPVWRFALRFNTRKTAQAIAMLALEVLGVDFVVHIEEQAGQYRVLLGGASIERFVTSLSANKGLPQARRLPEAVFRAGVEESAHFILGLCQATSGTYQKAGIRYHEFAMASRDAAADLKLVLLQKLGIVSGRLHATKDAGCLLLFAGRESLTRFRSILTRTPTALVRVRDAAPLWSESMAVEDEVIESLSESVQAEFYFDAVRSVVEEDATWVYDLTVPRTHAFVASGFVVHNTFAR